MYVKKIHQFLSSSEKIHTQEIGSFLPLGVDSYVFLFSIHRQ